jgi:hypothetical protein
MARQLSTKLQKPADHPADDADALITSREARGLLGGRSEMFIYRLVNVPHYAHLKFPKPIKINSRNYFRRRATLAWIATQEERTRQQAAAQSRGPAHVDRAPRRPHKQTNKKIRRSQERKASPPPGNARVRAGPHIEQRADAQ